MLTDPLPPASKSASRDWTILLALVAFAGFLAVVAGSFSR
jgi:hypothetical protein